MKVKRIIAIILVTAIVYTGLASLVAWLIIRNNRKNSQSNNPTNIESVLTGNGGMEIEEEQGSAIRLMSAAIPANAYFDNGISEQAVAAYSLTATITPSNASNQTVDWTIAWGNAESSWASGKTVEDYVTVNPTSDGSLVANVECSQAFGEQVIITVTSRDNTAVKAQCHVDYAKRVTKTDLKLSKNYMSDDTALDFATGMGSLKLYGTTSTGEKKPTFTTTTSLGTVEDEYTYHLKLRFRDDFKSQATAAGITYNEDFEMECTNGLSTSLSLVEAMFGEESVNDPETYNVILDFLNKYGGAEVEFVVETTGTYSSKVDTYACFLGTSNMTIRVTGLAVDNSSLII